jgi:plasmid maintenance system killer protein
VLQGAISPCQLLGPLFGRGSAVPVKNFDTSDEQRLKGNRKDFHSIRINDQWRVVFRWAAGNAFDVQIVDYH